MRWPHLRDVILCAGVAVLPWLAGCAGPCEAVLGLGAATALAGHYPANEIEQIYYLGVFDPQEQVPPTVYRVRVRGQASVISLMRFASGWVPADLIDSLGGQVTLDPNDGSFSVTKDAALTSHLPTSRKLVLFGPEGFREAPKGHRLVIVMGSSPETFFEAIDTSLGMVTRATVELEHGKLNQELLRELLRLRDQQDRVDEAYAAVEERAAGQKGGK